MAGRIFFKDDGWYRFWVAIFGDVAMVFRMPENATEQEIAARARAKLKARKVSGNFRIHASDEAGIVRWLMGHRKKAELGEI